jgi:hypothetical protein
MTMTKTRAEREPCEPGCPGYGAFDVGREPHPGLEYGYNEALEIQRCDACHRYMDDEEAYQAWIDDGRPALCGETELAVEEEPPDDIEIHELLAQLAKKARGLGWDLPKLQDRVYAYFETVEETPA